MKFGFVAKYRAAWPAGLICETLGLSRSGFYAWLVRPQRARAQHKFHLGAAVRASFAGRDRTYGARRVRRDVLAAGYPWSVQRIARLMRAQALRAWPRRGALPTDTGDRSLHAIAPSLLDRNFTSTAPNQKWVAGSTNLWTRAG